MASSIVHAAAAQSNQGHQPAAASYGQYVDPNAAYWQQYGGWQQQYGGYQQPGYGYEGQAAYPAQGYPGGGGQMMPGQHPGQPVEDEFELIEHSTPVDIEKLNRELFERNQELYDALDDARWTPFNPDKALPAVVKAAEENGTAVTA